MKFKSIASRIIVSIVPLILIVVLVFSFTLYFSVEGRINTQINNTMNSEITAARLEMQNRLTRASEVAHALAAYMDSVDRETVESGKCADFLKETLSADTKISGIGVWYAPFKFDPGQRAFQYYVYTDNGKPTLITDFFNRVDYQQTDWFINAMSAENGGLAWSDLYYDSLTGGEILTVSAAFTSGGEVVGVATVDIRLTQIREIIAGIEVGKTGRAFLLSENGGFITWFDNSRRFDAKIQYDKDPELAAFGREIMENQQGDAEFDWQGKAFKAFYRVIPETGWIITLLVEQDEISSSVFTSVLSTAAIPIVGLALAIVMILFVTRYLRNVTNKVNRVAEFAASGDLSHNIEITERDEFGRMEANLNMMINDMKKLIAQKDEAVDEAKDASRAKGDFLSKMSHEIRTPLNAIIGMTVIGKGAASTERKDYAFGKIEDASTHLLGVINDILDISKIEAGKLELSSVDFNFEKMLQKVVNVINFRIDERGQSFSVHIDRRIPQVLYGDDQRLAQVVTNLLSNAVKFTPEKGRIRLEAELKSEEDGICAVQVSVSDTGIGLNPEQLSRLFTSFQQADSSTSRKYGGTGLGLSISKRIVELMDGEIWVESEEGKGSTFAFAVKLRRGNDSADEASEAVGSAVTWKNTRLLVVDDQREVLQYFTEITEEWGVSCETAASGDEAIALIDKNGPYDMYFIDWKMPGMDGIELSRRIRRDETIGASIIIMISGADLNVIEADAKNAGVNSFLPKPLFPSSIADIISKYAGNTAVKTETPCAESADFSGHHIMIAEDIEINREIIRALFEATNIDITFAEDGAVAVGKFSADPWAFEMIFMDVMMPEMDGLEATRRIRALNTPRAKTVPIIAMTANVFREDIEQCLAAGMNGHVGKPIDFDEVIAQTRKYLDTQTKEY